MDDLLDLLTIDTLNAIVRWLSVYWYIPVAVVVGIGILIVLLHITYRRKLKKPLKRRINSMRRSVRGESDRGRGVSEAQTGGVGGVDRSDGAQRRRGGAPRQISQRKQIMHYNVGLCSYSLLWYMMWICHVFEQLKTPEGNRFAFNTSTGCTCTIHARIVRLSPYLYS